MLILHGSWLMNEIADPHGGFALWAETNSPMEKRSASSQVAFHSFAADAKTLRRELSAALPETKPILRSAVESAICAQLPSTNDAPLASPDFFREDEPAAPKPHLATWRVDALIIPPADVFAFLVALPAADDLPIGIKIGADVRFWQIAGKVALEILAAQKFVPTLVQDDARYLALWQPQFDQPNDEARMARLAKAMPPICRALACEEKANASSPHELLDNFFSVGVDAFARWHAVFHLPPFPTHPTLADTWMSALCARTPVIQESVANLSAFYEQYRTWREPFPGAAGGATFRICFRLDPPETTNGGEGIVAPKATAHDWSLQYFLQANDDPSLLVPAEAVWRERGSALRFLNRKFDAPQERLLAGLGVASRMFPPIETSLRHARPESCALNVEQAYIFIRETALLLQSFGFGVLVPGISRKLSVRVNLKSKQKPQATKGGVAGITFDSIVEYDWQLALGGAPLSREEFERLAAMKTPLVQIRGQWAELRPEQIEQAIKFWEKRKDAGELSVQEALRLALAQDVPNSAGLPVSEVVAEGWFGDLLKELASGETIRAIETPAEFRGELRVYQSAGVSWLEFLRQWGFGACLADDMGLGKTPQMIASLLHARAKKESHRPALVIAPTSVVSNWQRELARFAPELRVLAYHGASRKKNDLATQVGEHDVVLSSYALLHRDAETLGKIKWGEMILDEAQNIKNPATKQAQAARKLAEQAQWRVALTGTPVENRLTELWSIFQFLNPGYLGSQADFYNRLAKPIERTGDESATKQLKSLVAPFILRRVKTDPNVIRDLPEKNEMKVFCPLTKEQATLYEAVVRDSVKRIEEAEGIERRGIVLGTIMKLKQVCNHPAQFLGDGSALAGRSGKLARLTEMLEEARAVHDRALVFTQFAEMGQLLKANMQETFGDEVLFLYGGVPAKSRTKMIDHFQNDPNGPLVFILSIKAGGVGLNLMRANHVFHFDRWWNPAVENQATDRAFRIGQTKNVQVHKFLCAGTFEEKIDAMIERKQALAASIVGTSEQWITEMTTEQLRDLFALRREAITDG
jgi:SNF2 family DNA or RNA helicase